ncbi:MAG: bifunctional diaminohydroxyphosphoribosylaminopyrimidine deaminase/5-amino-6-(5-phosphoribosylamino)uracil reductase RibD [Burkholderiales bacterium]|jgi:diaminohydroxyphosphoribosylaminopyrimidine deaminase/5-amino-6-(5-phosphoribosylamino)uracil reductase|nr:bifunctional diaminohydroxyphosphoribosylaminopyrimidine deaminase/5-amino-6-(5-phosphoribosylamino)uracil reductase RibD [Burkholderiales bacterium]
MPAPQPSPDLARVMMARALALAGRGLFTATPNPRVGCVIARGEAVLGEGWHERPGLAHAEVAAIDDARSRGNDVRGAIAYVSLEPCNHRGRTGPCTEALIAAGIGRVVAAMRDPNPAADGGAERLREAGVPVDFGPCEAEALELNRGFVSNQTRGIPWVRTKLAASLDGRTALADGTSRWITGAEARADGHAWRARACAILTGVGTVRHDDPELTVRAVETTRQPVRVVVDRHAQLPPAARVLAGGNALVVTAGGTNAAWPAGVETLALPDRDGRVDLAALMRALAKRGVNELHVEAGARLNGALLEADLIDEMLVYLAPSAIGEPARGMFGRREGLAALDGRTQLAFTSVERVGEDLRVLARVVREAR